MATPTERTDDDRSGLLAAWRREETGQPEGWDFSVLDGRMTETTVPWDLEAIWAAAIDSADAVLDMGTAGGEFLLRFADDLPADTTATEGWGPNVPVARRALEPNGIAVVEFGQPDDDPEAAPMPFPDSRFDLVLNRHEAYHPAEIARVLRPGGSFLTQQVGSDELTELHALIGPPSLPDVQQRPFRAALEEAGLAIVDGDEADGHYIFPDVAAVVAYLQLVPWQVPPDFTVDRYANALFALHDAGPARGEPVRLTRRRFWLHARKPA